MDWLFGRRKTPAGRHALPSVRLHPHTCLHGPPCSSSKQASLSATSLSAAAWLCPSACPWLPSPRPQRFFGRTSACSTRPFVNWIESAWVCRTKRKRWFHLQMPPPPSLPPTQTRNAQSRHWIGHPKLRNALLYLPRHPPLPCLAAVHSCRPAPPPPSLLQVVAEIKKMAKEGQMVRTCCNCVLDLARGVSLAEHVHVAML